MYRQQSLITLDEFYELKPLTKLAATTIRSGKNEHSPMRIKILYNGF